MSENCTDGANIPPHLVFSLLIALLTGYIPPLVNENIFKPYLFTLFSKAFY